MKPTFLDLEKLEKRLWKNMVEAHNMAIKKLIEDINERLEYQYMMNKFSFTAWVILLIGLVIVFLKK